MRRILATLFSLIPSIASAQECKYLQTYEGTQKVYETKDEALVFRAKFYVNTDGSVRSYHQEDIRGQDKAINNICNGVNVTALDGTKYPGGSNATCPGLRKNFILARDTGWTTAKAPKVDFFAIATKSCEPSGKCEPCVTSDGYLVSTTSLENGEIKDKCDPRRYFDLLTLPAIVIPKKGLFIDKGVRVGDLAVVRSRTTGKVFGALVGDTGPTKSLGEGTVFAAMELRDLTDPPKNYPEAKVLSLRSVDYAIFPGSRSEIEGADRFDAAKINKIALERFNRWGGSGQRSKCVP